MDMLNKVNGMCSGKNRGMQLVVTMMILAAVLCGCSEKTVETAPATEAETTVPTVVQTTVPEYAVLTVDSTEEQEDMVVVNTSFGQVKYPFAFSDLIRVSAVNDADVAALEFKARISDVEYPLFTIRFGGTEEDILLGTMDISTEIAPRNVYAIFGNADEAALGSNVNTYLAAQEIFNDVAASLAENAGFTPAQ